MKLERMILVGWLVGSFAVTGCSAASSALGVLAPKPTTQITIVNAPQMTATTGVATAVPAPAAADHGSAKRAMLTGGVAGALAGGIVMRGSTSRMVSGALLGAGVGSLAGYVVHQAVD